MDELNKTGDLKDRTYQYSLSVVNFCRTLPETQEAQDIRTRLFDKSSNIGLMARLAFKGRNNNDFKDKLRRIINDADECIYWFDMLIDLNVVNEFDVDELMSEASELIAIFISITKKSRNPY